MKAGILTGSSIGSLLLAAALIRAVVGGPGVSSTSEVSSQLKPTPSPVTAEKQDRIDGTQDGPWRASQMHFAGLWPHGKCPSYTAQTAKTGKTSPGPGTDPRQQVWCIPGHEKIRAMIAIVPDPVHTHMSLQFDRSMEALQLAAESRGYVIDRYWLPWHADKVADAEAAARERQPGVLLFRWNGAVRAAGPNLLFIFVVSDTSTAGINGSQFARATEYLDMVCTLGGVRHAGCDKNGRISVMGPTFSGSLFSLRQLADAQKNFSFAAFSGTVSSSKAPEFQDLHSECPGSTECKVVFRSLVHDSESARDDFVAALLAISSIDCNGPAQIAILSEAGTSFGAASRRPADKKKTGDTPTTQCPVDDFVFPREIASLRNAYQSNKSATPQPVAGATDQNNLPFNLTDVEPNESDEPPNFAAQIGPLSKESVLMDFAAEFRRKHYRYVGISASNVLDTLFLANYLRSACPDVRLFILNSDLLFERNQDNVPYIGTLSVTTYPLIGRNRDRFKPSPPRRPFADQYEEGQYNAAIAAMQNVVPDDEPLGHFTELADPLTPGSADNVIPDRLPLWMTAVGTGGYWPVQIILPKHANPSPDPKSVAVNPTVFDERDFSPAWSTVSILLIALSFIQIIVLASASPLSARFRDFAISGAACAQRVFFIQVSSATLALCVAMILTPAWRFGANTGGYVMAIAGTGMVAIVGLLAISIRLHMICWDITRNCADERSRPSRRRLTIALHLGIWLVALGAELVWLVLHANSADHYGYFFAYRVVHLATGVSPFTPLLPLFAALYIWCLLEIWRLRFHDSTRPRLDAKAGLPGSDTEGAIAQSITGFFLSSNYLMGCAVVFGVWMFFLHPTHPFEIFEHREFSRFYAVELCVIVLAMLTSGFRLGQTWSRLRKLLQDLGRSSFRGIFSQLTPAGWSPIWHSGGPQEEWNSMARCFELLEDISRGVPEASPLRNDLDAAKAARISIRETYRQVLSTADDKQRDRLLISMADKFRDIQVLLARIMNSLAMQLRDYWAQHGTEQPEAGGNPEKPDAETTLRKKMQEYVALRYVAFIRGTLEHIKHMLIFLAISFSLVLISLNVYSFEPHQSLIWSFTAIFGVIGITVVGVLMEAYRDTILSRISGTTPNELGAHFYVRLIAYGAGPLLTLLATHFPSIGRYLLSFFQPGLEALK
jgi:hypothetical protein